MQIRIIFVLAILSLAVLGCVEETPEDSTPTPTPIRISAERLWAERGSNATRFDDTYKGEVVQIYGVVGEIERGDVRLVVDDTLSSSSRLAGSLGLDIGFDMPLLQYIALQDLPREQQSMANEGEGFQAICKVEDFVFTSMNLGDCHSGQPIGGE